MKKCSKCLTEYPQTKEYFYGDRGKKDGLTTQCKRCKNNYHKEYVTNNSDKLKTYQLEYNSNKENKERKRKTDKRYREENREKKIQYHKEYYEKHKEKLKSRARAYNLANRKQISEQKKNNYSTFRGKALALKRKQKRRSILKTLPTGFTVDEWRKCLVHFNNSCAYCGDQAKLEQEHFVAVNNGGGYTKDNILPSCLRCNRSKRDYDFFEWYPEQDYYSQKRENKIINYLKNQT